MPNLLGTEVILSRCTRRHLLWNPLRKNAPSGEGGGAEQSGGRLAAGPAFPSRSSRPVPPPAARQARRA
ncbi:hypothetical protein AB0J28_49855, partial [Streptosporangium canum]|uniref:hypothetical protein n=1 Tax=Streptosporangium canum TaxID=324952 RepID=UPI0034350739